VVEHEPAFRADRAAVVDLMLARGAPLDAFTALARGDAAQAHGLPPAAWRRKLGVASRGATPLHAAAARGDLMAVRLALACGADPAARDDWGITPRAEALAAGHADVAAVLAAQAPGLDPATAIALHDWEAAAAAHIDFAASPYAHLVHWAVHRGDHAVLQQLLDRGADPNVMTWELHGDTLLQLTPLHVAAKRGDLEAARLLLDRGADPDRAAAGGTAHTPLHAAAASDAADVAALLLARGADRGVRDAHYDATALEWARFFHHAAVAAAIEDAP
jgi:ankyrin repeat protein